jgi:GC-rich sequence DNA-binding factor
LDDREAEMRDMVGRAEEKRAWFNSFKEWVEGVAGFLDEKVSFRAHPLIGS